MCPQNNLHILVVDSQPIFRRAIRDLLLASGWENISEFESGVKAVEYVSLNPCDLVLIDTRMPEMSGLEAIEKINGLRLTSIPKFLIISSDDSFECINQAIDIGAKGYTLKTSSIDELERGIKSVIDGEEYFHPKIVSTFFKERFKTKPAPKTNGIRFSEVEKRVLTFLCHQLDNQEIADRLNISIHTVLRHKQNIKERVGAKTLIGCVMCAIKNQIISVDDF